MLNQKVIDLIKNDATIENEMTSAKTVEELQAVFARRGVTVTEDELDELVVSTIEVPEGELSEDDLSNVAGGISLKQLALAWKIGGCIGISLRRLYDKYKHGNPNYTYSFKDFQKMLKDGRLSF